MDIDAYFISGLGADHRAFVNIRLPEGISVHHLGWIPPVPGETLAGYASRMAVRVNAGRPFILVGLSLGGMVATEMAKILSPRLTILISSVVTRNELPVFLRALKYLPLHRLIPARILRIPNPLTFKMFGVKTSFEQLLMQQVLKDCGDGFLKWAISAIAKWDNTVRPENLYHIHGSNDRLLPVGNVKPDLIIDGGRHFMVVTRAGEINEAIARHPVIDSLLKAR